MLDNNPLCSHAETKIVLLQTGWIQIKPPSNSAAGLRSNVFATQNIIAHQKQADFQGFEQQNDYLYLFL